MSGEVEDLLGGTSHRLRVSDPQAAAVALEAAGMTVRRDAGSLDVVTDEPGEQITRVLAEAGLYLSELTPVRADLETIFLELTADDRMGGPATMEEVR